MIDLGPFKHKVDEALPLRKAVLACCDSIVDNMTSVVDVGVFASCLTTVLSDVPDNKLLAHQVICKLCVSVPLAVLEHAEGLSVPLENTIAAEMKALASKAAAGPESERALEQLRGCVQAVVSINGIEDVGKNQKWQKFVESLEKKDVIAAMMREAGTQLQEKEAAR